jgi:hypothetical protein
MMRRRAFISLLGGAGEGHELDRKWRVPKAMVEPSQQSLRFCLR